MPDFTWENNIGGTVAGVDEAGRGPWAGPVVAAAVILVREKLKGGINDSKQLSAARREGLYAHLTSAHHWHVGMASVEEIDNLNILAATKLAMQRAVAGLTVQPDAVLVDGNQPPLLPCKTVPLVKGDALSLSIAAASIIAKVTRDRLMAELALSHPGYGWERNAGYGTKAHQEGIASLGITPHHRRSFAPIRAIVERQAA